MLKSRLNKLLQTTIAIPAVIIFSQTVATQNAYSQAGIFEVVHPDVEKGEIEIEVLNGFATESVEGGEERSAHEFAIGYGFTERWKATAAVEIVNPRGDDATVEGFEFESLLLLTEPGHHDEDKLGEDDHHFTLGLFTALEVPREGGISEGALEIGPVFETQLGALDFVGNVLAEIPFEDGEDAGLAYAAQTILPVNENFAVGIENFGEFEGLFGDRGEDEHFAGPALYWEAELDNGHVIEPRLAVLFGLNDNTPDATISFNVEYKIGQ